MGKFYWDDVFVVFDVLLVWFKVVVVGVVLFELWLCVLCVMCYDVIV